MHDGARRQMRRALVAADARFVDSDRVAASSR
jgi:hypothetical protein